MLYINQKKIKGVKLNNKEIKKIYLNGKIVYEKIYYFSFDQEEAGWDKGIWFVEK